ncbi:hypothetical protein B6U99_02955 [Candidatus Geothermarchaeota archaeon ex4572_27]|nr:MAG: hypothetical protein B6U99_02955 [Candidatus Geothermarchaeota archaeon ex4572_27]
MKLCISGLPRLDGAVYYTARLRPSGRPSLAIPLEDMHLLFRALCADGLLTPHSSADFLAYEAALSEFKLRRLDLEILETVAYRHEGIARKLRGYFTSEAGCEGGVVAPATGLENVSLASLLAYSGSVYVIDARDVSLDPSLLRSVARRLESSGEVYLVSDAIPPWLPSPDEILIGPLAHVSALSRVYRDVHNLGPGVKLIRRGSAYEVVPSGVEWLEEGGRYTAEWSEPPRVDYISIVFRGVDEDRVEGVVRVLAEMLDSGGKLGQELLEDLTDILGHLARPALYLLVRYGLVAQVRGPLGVVYALTERGVRCVLERLREGEGAS